MSQILYRPTMLEKLSKLHEAKNWKSLKEEISKPQIFLDPEITKGLSDEGLLAYWRGVTENLDTEAKVEKTYIEAWSHWRLNENEIETAHIAACLAKFLLFVNGPTKFNEKLMELAINISTKINGKDNIVTAQNINDLGFIYDELGQAKKAKSLYKKAFEIRKRILETDHPAIAESLNNLATHYSEKKALPILQEALEIRLKSLGPHHQDTLNSMRNVASTLDLLGKHQEAKDIFLKTIEICENHYGTESYETAYSLIYFGVFLWHNDSFYTAQDVTQRALNIREKIFGKNSLQLILPLTSLSTAYSYDNKFDAAEACLQRALNISINANGQDHSETENIRNQLIKLDSLREDAADAENSNNKNCLH